MKIRTTVACLAAGLIASGCDTAPPDIPFQDSGDRYSDKVDFARIEHELPLSPQDLMKITPENLETLTQEQVDQLYAHLTAGTP